MTAVDNRPLWRRPVWMVGHLVALVGIVGFIALGFWQYDRHLARTTLDERVAQRLDEAPVPLASLLTQPVDLIEYRPVSVTGFYASEEEVVWRARTLDGVSGNHVITPLVLADGRSVVVDRGWVPIDLDDPPVAVAAPPTGEVTVIGLVRRPQPSGGLGPRDPADGRLSRISRLIPARLADQITSPLIVDYYIQRLEPSPGDGELPLIGELPEPGGGPPHLSYAVQWWAFAAVVAVGYPVLLYRTSRKHVPA